MSMERAFGAHNERQGNIPPQIDPQKGEKKPGKQIQIGFADKKAYRDATQEGWRSPLYSEKFQDSNENFLSRLRIFAAAFDEKTIVKELKDMGFEGALGENGFTISPNPETGKLIIEIPARDGSVINTHTGIHKDEKYYDLAA